MTTLDPCLSADELRVYVACVQLHDAGKPVTADELYAVLRDIVWSNMVASLANLHAKGIIRTVHVPLYRVELDRTIVRREVGR